LVFTQDKKLGILHSNRFPAVFEEKVFVIFRVGEKMLMDIAILNIEKEETVHEFKYVSQQVKIFFTLAWQNSFIF
jgi:hypothetical protein